MQIRGLLVAVVILGLLAGGVYWSDQRKAADEAKEASGGEAKLVHVASEDVRKLAIQTRDAAPVVLERDASKQWQMRAPETWRVDQDAATEIAGSYAGLSYDRIVDEKPAGLEEYGLTTPVVTLTATGKDGQTGKLLIGDESPTGTGVYAKLAGDARVYLVSTSVKTTISKSASDVRDKRLLVFDPAKVTSVGLTAKGGPIEFGRNAQNEWQIVKPTPQRADNGQVEDLVQKLSDARMDTSVPADEAARIAAGFPSGTRIALASVSDASGVRTLEVRKRGEDFLARSSSTPGVFKIAADIGESMNKSLDDFRNRKLFDFGFNPPSSVSVRDEGKTFTFRKSGENWTNAAGKQMDATSVQNLIDKLRDLTAVKIVNSGFGVPVIELSVISDDGKRNEKLLISKTGDSYFARRENEPATYQLDAAGVAELQRAAGDVKEPPPPPPPAKK